MCGWIYTYVMSGFINDMMDGCGEGWGCAYLEERLPLLPAEALHVCDERGLWERIHCARSLLFMKILITLVDISVHLSWASTVTLC